MWYMSVEGNFVFTQSTNDEKVGYQLSTTISIWANGDHGM